MSIPSGLGVRVGEGVAGVRRHSRGWLQEDVDS